MSETYMNHALRRSIAKEDLKAKGYLTIGGQGPLPLPLGEELFESWVVGIAIMEIGITNGKSPGNIFTIWGYLQFLCVILKLGTLIEWLSVAKSR